MYKLTLTLGWYAPSTLKVRIWIEFFLVFWCF